MAAAAAYIPAAAAAAAAAAPALAPPATIPFARLAWWSTAPVLKVVLMCSLGALLARPGLLDADGCRVLSRLGFCVFTPALTFTVLAPALARGADPRIWLPLPLNVAASVAAGLALGALLRPLAPPGLRAHVVAATGLGNVGNLPLVLVAALVREAGASALGAGASVEDGVAYVALGIVVANVSHFTIGMWLLRAPRPAGAAAAAAGEGGGDDCGGGDCGSSGGMSSSGGGGGKGAAGGAAASAAASAAAASAALELAPVAARGRVDSDLMLSRGGGGGGGGVGKLRSGLGGGGGRHSGACEDADGDGDERGLLLGPARPLLSDAGGVGSGGGGSARRGSSPGGSSSGGGDGAAVSILVGSGDAAPDGYKPGDAAAPGASAAGAPHHQHHHHQQQEAAAAPRGWRRAARLCRDTLAEIINPPLIASSSAVAVGLSPPLHAALFGRSTSSGGKEAAEEAPLALFTDVLRMMGDCCIPALMLLLGATLAAAARRPAARRPPWRVILAVAGARLVALPLLGVAWVLAARAAGAIRPGTPRLLVVVMLIQNAAPTALNMQTIATMNGNRPEEMGALIAFQYFAGLLAVPVCLFVFLRVCGAYF